MQTAERRRPGRPKVGEGGRSGEFVGFRCPSDLKADIEKAATAAGRSISTEVQFRVANSFRATETLADAQRLAEKLAYGERGANLLQLFGRIIRRVPGRCGMDVEADWLDDATAFNIFEREIVHMLRRLRPKGEPAEIAGESPENGIDRLLVGLKMIEPPQEWAEDTQ